MRRLRSSQYQRIALHYKHHTISTRSRAITRAAGRDLAAGRATQYSASLFRVTHSVPTLTWISVCANMVRTGLQVGRGVTTLRPRPAHKLVSRGSLGVASQPFDDQAQNHAHSMIVCAWLTTKCHHPRGKKSIQPAGTSILRKGCGTACSRGEPGRKGFALLSCCLPRPV